MLESWKHDILRKVRLVGKSLLRGQESQVLRGQVGGWETGAVIPMFQDYTKTIGSFGQFVEDALLQEYQALRRVRLSGLQHDDGTAGLVVSVVEEVSQLVGAIAVRLVLGVVVEVVDWHREGVRGIQKSGIGVPRLQSALVDGILLLHELLPDLQRAIVNRN